MIIHNICDKLFILFIGKFILRRKLMGRTMKSVFIKFPTENPRAFRPWDEWRLEYIFY